MQPNRKGKILILAANPKETTRLRLDEEVKEVVEALRRSDSRDVLEIEQRWAVQMRDVRRALLDVRPRFVHFSGHGSPEGLVFQDADGKAVVADPEALTDLFGLFSNQIECVLLNACYSGPQAEAISQHINHVIGMSRDIRDKAAIEFSVGFYDAIGAQRSIEDAFKFGTNAVHLAIKSGHLIPLLHSRPSSGSRIETSDLGRIEDDTARKAIEIFYSYSYLDEKLRLSLEKQLAVIRRQGMIVGWNSRKIKAGEEWEGAIDEHLKTAGIVLLLISPDFLASDYCYDVEMKVAMERHERREAIVIPVILRPCDWHMAPFGKLLALPRDGKPVTSWTNRDEAFLNVAAGIRSVVEGVRA